MQKLRINNKLIKVKTEWSEITVDDWIILSAMNKIDIPFFLSNVNRKTAYLITKEVSDKIIELTNHFIANELKELPLIFTYRKTYKGYKFPDLTIINGNDLFLFNEQAYTFCQAHDALMAAFSNDKRFIFEFMAYYLRKPYQDVTEQEVLKRAAKMGKLPMTILLELLFHHMNFLNVLADDKQFPGLFGKSKTVTNNPVGGLGFTAFLHEWAMDKGVSINDIEDNVNDFFQHISYIRTMRKLK